MVPSLTGSLASAANQTGANNATNLFAGTAPAGLVGAATFGICPSAAPYLTAPANAEIPYVALGF